MAGSHCLPLGELGGAADVCHGPASPRLRQSLTRGRGLARELSPHSVPHASGSWSRGLPGDRIFQGTAPRKSTVPSGYCMPLGSPQAPVLLQEPPQGPTSMGVCFQRGKRSATPRIGWCLSAGTHQTPSHPAGSPAQVMLQSSDKAQELLALVSLVTSPQAAAVTGFTGAFICATSLRCHLA